MFAPDNSLTLSQLNVLIKKALNECFIQSIWIRAEISDVKTYQSGHCYFEFLEKDINNETIIAKAPGRIWANVFRNLRPYFESETGQLFTSGIKILVRVTIDFHPLYGMSLNVQEIDPSFTLGDMVMKRREILMKLEKNGILTENIKKKLISNPQRIAVISSASAAGFEDFYNQLHNNTYKYSFITKLFPSLMQGKEVEKSMLIALNKVRKYANLFDAVVIIRGGGATSDLNCFDSYPLAEAIATFPLPVIVGIGHDRDKSVLDEVAFKSVKTPTAVAEFLLSQLENAEVELHRQIEWIKEFSIKLLFTENQSLNQLTWRIPQQVNERLHNEKRIQEHLTHVIGNLSRTSLAKQKTQLDVLTSQLQLNVTAFISKKNQELILKEKIVELSSPDHIMEKGYVFVTQNKHLIKLKTDYTPDKTTTIHFRDGDVEL
ncbi:MAG: exodeoxyribonuclease VII large subunit [Bacteroidales bacterium]